MNTANIILLAIKKNIYLGRLIGKKTYITNTLSSWTIIAMKIIGMQQIHYNLCSGKYSYAWSFQTCHVSDEHFYLKASTKYVCFFLQ